MAVDSSRVLIVEESAPPATRLTAAFRREFGRSPLALPSRTAELRRQFERTYIDRIQRAPEEIHIPNVALLAHLRAER